MNKVEFDIVEKNFTSQDGNTINYYVLQKKLITGDVLEIPVKKDKCKLLLMSLTLENKK